MIPILHFYMIRHGQSEANLAQVVAGGGVDTPLSSLGRAEAEEAREIVSSLALPPRTIVHSNLSRARDTARILNTSFRLPMQEDSDLREFDAGDLEGAPFEVFRELILKGGDPPNGERQVDFRARVRAGMGAALSAHPAPVLLVTHGGIFRGFGEIYGVALRGVRNCHLYEFEPKPEPANFPWRVWQYEKTDAGIQRLPFDPSVSG